MKLVSDYAFEDTATRFVKGLSLYIKDKMPIFNIYNLQHAISLAKQIESQILSQIRRERSQALKQLRQPHSQHKFEIPGLITS